MVTKRKTAAARPARTVDPEEIARFDKIAARWWDERGDMRPLHKLNPLRVRYIEDRLIRHFGLAPRRKKPLAGLRILDIGCGGGILTEALARLGARMTGADMAKDAIAVAKTHAKASKLAIDYRVSDIETIADAGETFDAVVAMEIVEHVADLDAFIEAAGACVRPGGALALSTLNRTARSFLLGVVAAEYMLGMVPRGTHDWRKFVRPSELARALRSADMTLADTRGVAVDPLTGGFRIADDLGVNYMAFAAKDAA